MNYWRSSDFSLIRFIFGNQGQKAEHCSMKISIPAINSIYAFRHLSIPAILMATIVLFSCKKEESTPASPGNSLSTQIQKRWDISGASFSSLEFNNSAQAIVVFGASRQNPDSVRSYFYRALDSKTIEIRNFGKMDISSISDTSIRFAFIPTLGNSINLSGNRVASSVGSASNTSLLCRTWKAERFLAEGEVALDFDTIGLLTVTFTSTGTYLVQGALVLGDSTGIDASDASLSWWKWNSEAPGQKFCYSHDSENFACDSNNVVSIASLTGSELIINEGFLGYELSPYNLPGRVALPQKQVKISPKWRKGVFGK